MLVALGMFPRLFPFTLCPLRVAASLCRNRAPGHAATRHPAPGRSIPPRRHPPARARKGARSHSTQPTGAAFHPPAHARVHARPAPAGTTGTLARLPHARACAGARAPRRPLGPLRPGPPPPRFGAANNAPQGTRAPGTQTTVSPDCGQSGPSLWWPRAHFLFLPYKFVAAEWFWWHRAPGGGATREAPKLDQ